MIKSETSTGIKDLIHTSVKTKNVISIQYQKDNGAFSNRKLYPIVIQKYKDQEYLEAFCLLRNNNRIFKLANIKSIIFFKKKYEGDFYSKLKVFGSSHSTININKQIKNRVENQPSTKEAYKPSIKKQETPKPKSYEGIYIVIFIAIMFVVYLYLSA